LFRVKFKEKARCIDLNNIIFAVFNFYGTTVFFNIIFIPITYKKNRNKKGFAEAKPFIDLGCWCGEFGLPLGC
jgi:hypothetical protein